MLAFITFVKGENCDARGCETASGAAGGFPFPPVGADGRSGCCFGGEASASGVNAMSDCAACGVGSSSCRRAFRAEYCGTALGFPASEADVEPRPAADVDDAAGVDDRLNRMSALEASGLQRRNRARRRGDSARDLNRSGSETDRVGLQ